MRLSELTGVEIINLYDATRLGHVIEVDAEIHPDKDRISGLRLTVRKGWWWGKSHNVPWESIRRIGRDLIIVDIPPDNVNRLPAGTQEGKKTPETRDFGRKTLAGRGI